MTTRRQSRFSSRATARVLGLAAPLACLAIVYVADAQSPSPLLSGKIVEAYSPSVNVGSGSGALVGLWLGVPAGTLDLKSVRVGIPAVPPARTLCFSAITRDGEYSARGPAAVPKGVRGPVGISSLQNSEYSEPLKRYQALDLAVSARWGSDCKLSPKSPYVPAVGSNNFSELVAAINSAHAIGVGATLQSRSAGEIEGQCAPVQNGRTTAFDTLCRFKLPAQGTTGEWNLALTRTPRAGPRRIDDFTILLPGPP
jgi:hypothetical protein